MTFFVFGNTFYSCLKFLNVVLKRCIETTNFKLGKFSFYDNRKIVLGHKISLKGIDMEVSNILNMYIGLTLIILDISRILNTLLREMQPLTWTCLPKRSTRALNVCISFGSNCSLSKASKCQILVELLGFTRTQFTSQYDVCMLMTLGSSSWDITPTASLWEKVFSRSGLVLVFEVNLPYASLGRGIFFKRS